MNIILISDVFGKTPALIELAKALDAETIVDPYNAIDMSFNNEAQAYAYFMDNVGLEVYLSKLVEVMKSVASASTLVGFSIGASILWQLSASPAVKNIKRGICYYGSQIRHFKAVEPLFELELVFPKKELHFDVLELQTVLAKKSNVNIIATDYLHGFMNLYSDNYDTAAYVEQLKWLRLNND